MALAPYDEDEIEITTEDRERQSVIPICLVKVGYKGAVEDEQRANIPRIIECVNAMTGIEDPAAFMEEVREVFGFVLDQFDELVNRHYGGDLPVTDEELVTLETARALLAKMEGK